MLLKDYRNTYLLFILVFIGCANKQAKLTDKTKSSYNTGVSKLSAIVDQKVSVKLTPPSDWGSLTN